MYYMIHSLDKDGCLAFQAVYSEEELKTIEGSVKGKYIIETVNFLRRGENK